jgi:hypothetical protein
MPPLDADLQRIMDAARNDPKLKAAFLAMIDAARKDG